MSPIKEIVVLELFVQTIISFYHYNTVTMLEQLVIIVYSFFVHGDFLEAFKAAPHGIWDYFHRFAHHNHPRLAAASAQKGYCQELFERELEIVDTAVKTGKEKLKTCSVDYSIPHQVADNLFYRINHIVLELKLQYLNGLVLSAKDVSDVSDDAISEYVHDQHEKVILVYYIRLIIFNCVLY